MRSNTHIIMADQVGDKTRKRYKFNRRYEPYSKFNPYRKCEADENQTTLQKTDSSKLTDKCVAEAHDKIDGQTSKSHKKLKVEYYHESITNDLEEIFKKGLLSKKLYELLLKVNGEDNKKVDGLLSSYDKKLTEKCEEAYDKIDGQLSFKSHEELKIEFFFHELGIKELKEMFQKGSITEKQYKSLLRQCELVWKLYGKQRD